MRFCARVLRDAAAQVYHHYNRSGDLEHITAVTFVTDELNPDGSPSELPSIEVEFANDVAIEGGTMDVWTWQPIKDHPQQWSAWTLTEQGISIEDEEDYSVLAEKAALFDARM